MPSGRPLSFRCCTRRYGQLPGGAVNFYSIWVIKKAKVKICLTCTPKSLGEGVGLVWDDDTYGWHPAVEISGLNLELRRINHAEPISSWNRWLYASEQQILGELLLLFDVAKSQDHAAELIRRYQESRRIALKAEK